MIATSNECSEINFVRLRRRVTKLEHRMEILEQKVSHFDIIKTGY